MHGLHLTGIEGVIHIRKVPTVHLFVGGTTSCRLWYFGSRFFLVDSALSVAADELLIKLVFYRFAKVLLWVDTARGRNALTAERHDFKRSSSVLDFFQAALALNNLGVACGVAFAGVATVYLPVASFLGSWPRRRPLARETV